MGRAEGASSTARWTATAAAEQIADNYLRFVKVYEDARGDRSGLSARGPHP